MSSGPSITPSAPSLSVFAGPSVGTARRLPASFAQLSIGNGKGIQMHDIEKDTEGLEGFSSARTAAERQERGTSAAVSQLFAASEPTSPPFSRHASCIRTHSGTQYNRAVPSETASLSSHLYSKGLLSGRHSDITVIAFGNRYLLHRILLDRAPYFCSALSEPWLESSAKEITLCPEENDMNITQAAFELALKRLYGCHKDEEEDKEPMGLFATGCWLDMPDLIEASLDSLLRQLCPANVSSYIKLVTNNYYGRYGERILAAAKAVLCQSGWEMPICYFDGISGDIIREVLGSDGFYVPREWDRFTLCKRVLNRRLRGFAMEAGLINGNGDLLTSRPELAKLAALRHNTVQRNPENAEVGNRWQSLYTSPDILPLLILLDEGIHYIHLAFEQLQRIRESTDALGVPIVPDSVILKALWMSMELRQRIVNARESDLELGLSHYLDDAEAQDAENQSQPEDEGIQYENSQSFGALSPDQTQSRDGDPDTGSKSPSDESRRFWVPLADATYPLGGHLEPVVSDTNNIYKARHLPRFTTSGDSKTAQWATDFASSMQARGEETPEVGQAPSPEVRYSRFPPFRFAVEFPSIKSLKERRRTYSSTIWYAGSFWNVYVQKTAGARHTQLGVYLHRERQPEGSDGMISILRDGVVDARIGQLERDMVSNRSRRIVSPRSTQPFPQTREDSGSSDEVESPAVAAAAAATAAARQRPSQDLSTLSGLLRSSRAIAKSSEAGFSTADLSARSMVSSAMESAVRMDDEYDDAPAKRSSKLRIPTLPPYLDARPTTRTYFKIFTPSKNGRVLTVYESGPDRFNFSQSWGWRSSNLILDDGLGGVDEQDSLGQLKEPRLRFMVVLGRSGEGFPFGG